MERLPIIIIFLILIVKINAESIKWIKIYDDHKNIRQFGIFSEKNISIGEINAFEFREENISYGKFSNASIFYQNRNWVHYKELDDYVFDEDFINFNILRKISEPPSLTISNNCYSFLKNGVMPNGKKGGIYDYCIWNGKKEKNLKLIRVIFYMGKSIANVDSASGYLCVVGVFEKNNSKNIFNSTAQ